MSFLCGCASKSAHCTPNHTPEKIMANIKPPSAIPSYGSRFGFSSKSQKKTPAAATADSSMEMSSAANKSAAGRPASAIVAGLTLDPSTLASDAKETSLDGYLRKKVTGAEVRPKSLISTISRASTPPQEESRPAVTDTQPPDKPKPQSRLKSFLRPFSKAKPAVVKAVNGHTASNVNMNNSKSDGTLSAKVCALPAGKNTNSVNYSSSSKSSMKKYGSKSSPQLVRTHTISSTTTHKTVTSTTKSTIPLAPESKLAAVPPAPESKLAAAPSVSEGKAEASLILETTPTTSLPKPTTELPKYATTKSKSSRISYPGSKPTNGSSMASRSSTKDQCLPNQVINDSKQLHNRTNAAQHADEGINIDSKCMTETTITKAEPVTRVDTNSATSSHHIGTKSESKWKPARDSSTVTTHSMPYTASNVGGGRKKPTIEINPLTQQDNPDATNTKKGQAAEEVEMGSLSTKKSASPASPGSGKVYTVDEETMNDVLLEVVSLRQALVELQFHLSGKQEYEEKMREELQLRNEIIANLQSELSHCSCPKKNGFSKLGEGDMTPRAAEKSNKR